MFYDYARIFVKGGDGGNGVVSFRREKYVPEGGPNGGDGGKGGDVMMVVNSGLSTLVDFRYRRHYKAERGEHGQGKNMHGGNGENLVIQVPPGTVVRDADTRELIADLVADGQRAVMARGGRGGRGNARFATATNRVPTLAENGEPGEEFWLEMELKLLADVGLIGFPNVGKSTLISRVSEAKPKIANYHFTTLVPNLGVVRVPDGRSFVMADIPGLIEGASTGAGLGHQFLRHTERTRLLLHVLDVSGTEGRDPVQDMETVNRELHLYNPELASRPQVIVANKVDIPGALENLEQLRSALPAGTDIFPISALTGEGVQDLVWKTIQTLDSLPVMPAAPIEEVRKVKFETKERFRVEVEDGVYVVSGKEIDRLFAITDFNNEAAVKRFQNVVRKMGVEELLREKGATTGDTVRIKDLEFEYVE